jgi:predicted branched-subunit amino acid permease
MQRTRTDAESVTTTAAAHAAPDSKREVARGALAMAALLPGLVPFGVLVGAANAASAAPAAGWAGTWLIYSGSAHLAVLQSLADGDGLLAVVVTGLLINARLVAFSASLAPLFRSQSRRCRLVAAALLVDPVWALVANGPGGRRTRSYYLGAGLVLWWSWAAAVVAGAVLARHDGLELATAAAPLCLLALVAPYSKVTGGLACLVAAALTATLSATWPAGSGVLAGMVAGSVAAALARRRSS